MKDYKWVAIENSVITIAVCACVVGATYLTKNANCLWGLVIIPALMTSVKRKQN